jgi:hypothetical protein
LADWDEFLEADWPDGYVEEQRLKAEAQEAEKAKKV